MLAAGCASRAPAAAAAPVDCKGSGTSARDRCIGWALDAILTSVVFRLYDDPALTGYVDQVGQRIAAHAGRPDLRFAFRVLDDPEPQGLALLGGFVYVTRGALAQLRSEAELAALLAHEIAHVALDHGDDLLEVSQESALSDPGSIRRRLGHERDDEIQADERAVGLLDAAGYPPLAMLRMLRTIDVSPDSADPLDSDYEPRWRRQARVARLIDGRKGGTWARARYLARIDGLVVGPDPSTGRLVGASIVVAAADLVLPIPRGWSAPDALHLERPDGARVEVKWLTREAVPAYQATIEWRGDARAGPHAARLGAIDTTAFGLVRAGRGAVLLAVMAPTPASARAALAEILAQARRPTRAEYAAARPARFRLE
jgi:hypothetical protein